MFTYVISFISFFDNDLKMAKVCADSPVDAIKESHFVDGYEFSEDATVEDIQSEMFDCDAAIAVLEI